MFRILSYRNTFELGHQQYFCWVCSRDRAVEYKYVTISRFSIFDCSGHLAVYALFVLTHQVDLQFQKE